MFVAGNARSAVEIARSLVDDPQLPPLRVGLAAGEIVTRDGDVFKPVVNRAARLVEMAEPEQIVCDAEAARRLGERTAAVSLGRRSLHGFDDPVEVYAVAAP